MLDRLKISYLVLILLGLIWTSCDDENEPVVETPEPVSGLVAKAGEDKSIIVLEEVELDGSSSYDSNNKSFSYKWEVKLKPSGSNAALTNSTEAKSRFTADLPGTYVVELQIKQDAWIATDQIKIVVASQTPGGEEPELLPVEISQNIFQNLTLSDIFEGSEEIDYIVTNDIEVRADLIIEAGVTIAFQYDKGMQILNGSIQANGTIDQPITFKGMEDQKGFWKGLVVYTNSLQNSFNYVTVKNGGSSTYMETGVKANLALPGDPYSGAALKVSHSTFSDGDGYGFYARGQAKIYVFENNQFVNNALAAAHIPAGQLHKIDQSNQASLNQFDGIETSGTLIENEEVTWKKVLNGKYKVISNIHLNGGVIIEPGVTFIMNEGVAFTLSPYAHLKAIGTENEKINFISYSMSHYWLGIYFGSHNGNNVLEHINISNGGYGKPANADFPANISIDELAYVKISNSSIKNSLGYGIVTKHRNNVNSDVTTVNSFENLNSGIIYPAITQPETPSLQGMWVDMWTLNHGRNTIALNLYDTETGIWFGGAEDPFNAELGFGLYIDSQGNFIWTTAEQLLVPECPSYNVEFMKGALSFGPTHANFFLDYWRSKFHSSCDESQSADLEVTPIDLELMYSINKVYNMVTGEEVWQLTFYNPDNSSFSFYKK